MKAIFYALPLWALAWATPCRATPLVFKYTFQTGDRITGHISEGPDPKYFLDSVVPAPQGEPRITLPGPPGDFDFMDYRDLAGTPNSEPSLVVRTEPNGRFLGVESEFHQDGGQFNTGMYITPSNRVFFQWLDWKVSRPDLASYRVSSTPETWEFLFPQSVPDGGSSAGMLSLGALLVAMVRKFLPPSPAVRA